MMTQEIPHSNPRQKQKRASDICANRHRGSEFSRAANLTGDKNRDRVLVLTAIRESYSLGKTLDEVAVQLGRAPNQLSGRFSELKALGLIVQQGRRKTRTGASAGVYVVAEKAGMQSCHS